MFDQMKAGRQIALFRKSRGLTQEEVACRLNISPQAVSKWENGRAMPELPILVELSELLECTTDQILFPVSLPAGNANFEQILLPYAPIADFTGRNWPRSMSKPAILSALKLFMGLEQRTDPVNRQINDDTEYILQAAFSGISFGYSWGPDHTWESCLGVYGLSCEFHPRADYSEEEFIRLAVHHIMSGYPVVVIPKEYTDTILATGFSHRGRILKGLPFLDGDDEKNSVMSFGQLKNFSEWYVGDSDLMLIKTGAKKVSLADQCREALQKGYSLLSNQEHQFHEPLVGHGLVIYDNWCEELQKETNQDLTAIECMFPHIFIHYEGKLRIREFLELYLHLTEPAHRQAITSAISKYEEILAICDKCLKEMFPKTPANADEARSMRQGYIGILQRTKELEEEALEALKQAGNEPSQSNTPLLAAGVQKKIMR